MGYLLKEALKALCGVNQWSYAIFWKIGCQNPKLLIWEECYYESLPSSSVPHNFTTLQKLESYRNGARVGNRVQLLVDKMMMSNQVNVVGEGLVGRAAFTGNHQWIVAGNFNEITHPAEVLNEVRLQFAAGMQTIAVIPVVPHGVVQFGSPLAVMENVGFVHDVRSLILQLGCVPSAFISDNYVLKDDCMFELPIADVTANPINLLGKPTEKNTSALVAGNFNIHRNSSETVGLVNHSSNSLLTQFQDNLQVSGSSFDMSNPTQCKSHGNHYAAKVNASSDSSLNHPNGLLGMEVDVGFVMTSKLVPPKKQLKSNYPCSGISRSQLSTSSMRSTSIFNANKSHYTVECDPDLSSLTNELVFGTNGQQGQSIQISGHTTMVFHDTDPSIKDMTDANKVLKSPSVAQERMAYNDFSPDGFCVGSQVPSSKNGTSEDLFFQSSAGDDLFDVLGVDLKNRLLNGNDTRVSGGFGAVNQIKDLPRSINLQHLGPGVFSDYEGISESGVFSSSGSDHLLDAVISGVSSTTRQTSDDNMSCGTIASKISNCSVPSTPHSNPPISGLLNSSDRLQQQLFGLSKPVVRLSEPIGQPIGSACRKNEGRNCSMTSSTYGSQISSWIEQGPSTSVSTANSKKVDEGTKANRKRLKPGDNPRPRPKDRQMIQDRVKELREIVPNAAKCSIDSLLERTIKHMLFLQCVTNHADKLKQTVESKIDDKEGGVLLKDNFEGGATWAFEVGSESMVCPIVVEDLNPPRQLLIEMICEERGFFLEIADIVRGLGLTILKGVMEARNDKIWARFAVEANRDVTRMEVFISLVHLLEQTLKSSIASVNGTSDENMVIHPGSMPSKQHLVGPIVCGEPSTT